MSDPTEVKGEQTDDRPSLEQTAQLPGKSKYNLLLNEDRAILGVAEPESRSYVSQIGLEKGRRK